MDSEAITTLSGKACHAALHKAVGFALSIDP